MCLLQRELYLFDDFFDLQITNTNFHFYYLIMNLQSLINDCFFATMFLVIFFIIFF